MSSKDRCVVIGTGAGGLMAATVLASKGIEVLVLEQAREFGGYLNPFKRRGYHFDVGLHYVGELGPGRAHRRLYERVGLDPDELFVEMDRDGFDHFRFPDFEIRQCADRGAWRERLHRTFPRQHKAIECFFAYLERVRRVSAVVTAFAFRAPRASDLAVLRQAAALAPRVGSTWLDLMESITDDVRLRAALSGNLACGGSPPRELSAFGGLALVNHFADGAWVARGTAGSLRDALVQKAHAHGADFRSRADVRRIDVRGGQVQAVELATGERVPCAQVVAAIDPGRLVGELIPLHRLPLRMVHKVARLQPSFPMFSVFLGMRRKLADHGLRGANIWDHPRVDPATWGMWDLESPPAFMMTTPTLTDTGGSRAPQGGSTADIFVAAPYAPFARWTDAPVGRRGSGYEALKAQLADRIVDRVQERLPGVVGDVEVQEAATPATCVSYVRTVEGSMCGPALTPGQFGPLRPATRTPVGGLYLAGASIFGGGVMPCMLSGQAAAAAVLDALGARSPEA